MYMIYSYIINILLCLKFNVFYQYTNPYHFIYSDFFDNAFDDHLEFGSTSYNEKKWKHMLAPYVSLHFKFYTHDCK